MPKIVYAVQRAGAGSVILNAYRELATNVPFDRLTGLYAFASTKGARLLTDVLRAAARDWSTTTKRWVISIDGGITEPDALRFLLKQRRAEVRIPDAEALLTRRLQPRQRFHPKTLLLELQIPKLKPTGLLVGSANLTCNGLCFGQEHALATYLDRHDTAACLTMGIDQLSSVVDAATRIDEDFVKRYEAIRPSSPALVEEFEDERADRILQERAVIPMQEAVALASATNLWVDIEKESKNRGPDKEGSQIDLKKGTRVFFGFGDRELPRNSPIGTIRINYAGHSALRNLRYGTNQMDKLDLPIPDREGPPSYRNQTLLFTREADGTFQMTVGTPDQIASWKRNSQELGSSFQMRRGREYGVF